MGSGQLGVIGDDAVDTEHRERNVENKTEDSPTRVLRNGFVRYVVDRGSAASREGPDLITAEREEPCEDEIVSPGVPIFLDSVNRKAAQSKCSGDSEEPIRELLRDGRMTH